MEQTIERFQPGVEALYGESAALLDAQSRSQLEIHALRWTQAGVPREIAARVAALDTLFAALDIVEIAESSHRPVATVGGVYFQLSSKLGLGWLRERIGKLSGDSHWQTLAKGSMRDDLAELQRTLARNVLQDGADGDAAALVAKWESANREAMERAARLLSELRAAPAPLDVARPGERRDPVQRRLDSGLRWNDALDFPRLRRPAPRTLPLPRSERRGARPAAPQPCRETLHTESDSHRGSLTPRTLRPR